MSSTTRLLVLGVVRVFQPVHGYDVRRELISWHVEEWASLAPGSIYSQLKTLAKEGLVEHAGTNQVGGRPERTLYRITARGEAELSELLRETLWQWRMPIDPLIAAVSLMGLIKRDELIAGLEARQAIITGGVAHAEYAINAIDDVETPAHVKEMLRLINARVSAELGWSRAFVERLRKGEYHTQDDPAWRPKVPGAARPKPRRKRATQQRTRRTTQKRR
ncbi:MAG: PadR family transcriptional regulator [Kofleriaceae bacterium]